jgi:hypothetical protein
LSILLFHKVVVSSKPNKKCSQATLYNKNTLGDGQTAAKEKRMTYKLKERARSNSKKVWGWGVIGDLPWTHLKSQRGYIGKEEHTRSGHENDVGLIKICFKVCVSTVSITLKIH